MNIGLLLEVLLVSLILLNLLSLFTLQFGSLTVLLLNERESRKILHLLVLSDKYISDRISLSRMGVKVNNLVDCGLLQPEANLYLRCGPFSFGTREGKVILRRLVVWKGRKEVFEVGIP